MKNYTTSKKLLKNSKNFFKIKYYSFFYSLLSIKGNFYGWGKKKSGLKAVSLAKKNNTSFILLEDGFIRSLGLGIHNSPSFSIVEDDLGIYYDATTSSKLEKILNNYNFISNQKLMLDANQAIKLIKKYNISKYNNAPNIPNNFFDSSKDNKVLIIAQTLDDSSLQYGMIENYTTQNIIDTAIKENPNATVYIKIHPDVLSGHKQSDIDIKLLKNKCIIIQENFNPISLLKHFKKVYTKTSGMGFEALLVGCECTCFGVPYYAGWGITNDKTKCTRRTKRRTIEEVFAAAYILYTRYYNPYKKKPSNIFDTINEINIQKINNGNVTISKFNSLKD